MATSSDPNVTNPILKLGQTVLDPRTGLFKIGDGHRHFLELPFAPASGGGIGPRGPQGPPGPKGADGIDGNPTIASVTNILKGDGLGGAVDSGIDPADLAALASVSANLASLMASADAALSARIDGAGVDINVVSQAASVANAHANTVSARAVSISAELASLVQVASVAASVALNRANIVSAKVETVSARVVSVSNELASLRAASVQVASAAATSADVHANTVSARAASISAELASLIASGDNALSIRANDLSALIPVDFGDLGGLVAFNQLDRSSDTVSEPLGVLTLGANTKTVTTMTGSLTEIQFSGGANEAQARELQLTVTGGPYTLIIPTCIRLGDDTGSTITIVDIPNGVHWLVWEFDGVNYILADSIPDSGANASATSADLSAASAQAASAINVVSAAANAISARVVSVSAELMSQAMGYSTTATAAGTTTLTANSPPQEYFTGSTTQTVQLPVVSTLFLGRQFLVVNNSSGALTVNSSGGNLVATIPAGSAAIFTCILTSGTDAASWSVSTGGGGSGSVTSQEASVISAHVDAVSARVVSVSNELGSLVNIVSARAVSISAELMSAAMGYSTTATAAGTTTLTANSPPQEYFTGSTTQTITLPVTSTLFLGRQFLIVNNSSGALTVNSSGGNLVVTIAAGTAAIVTCILTSGTGAASWSVSQSSSGSGSVTSAEASAISAQAASAINVVSARAVSISNELGSLLASASAALETHAATASAAATSADAHANTVSARAVSISAELASLIQIASAAATSADAHANTVSARAASISAELASLVQIASLAATSADAHANTVSARAVSISNELGSLLASTSAQLRADITSASAVIKADIASVSAVIAARAASISAELMSQLASTSAALSTKIDGYTTTATAGATTTLTSSSNPQQYFTGSTTQTVQLPVTSTLYLGKQFLVVNNSSGVVTITSSGGNTVKALAPGTSAIVTCILTSGTDATSWSVAYSHDDTISARVVSVSNELGSLLASTSAQLKTDLNSVSVQLHADIASASAILAARAASISAEVVSLITSQTARRATNTAAQASITVSGGSTVSGVSIALTNGQTYAFEFFIPFVANATVGIVVAVLSPTVTTYGAHYAIPGSVAAPGVLPAAAQMVEWASPTTNTKYSTVSITLTGVTLNARAWGVIKPSADGSLKFLIGPGTTNVANNGVVVQLGANLRVWRIA